MLSPNYSPNRTEFIQFIVCHFTDGQPNLDKSVKRFCDPKTKASAHFVIGQDGTVVQLVDILDRAWHCQGWNDISIGIEHICRSPNELNRDWRYLSEQQRRALLPEATPIDLSSDLDPGFPPTQPQLLASARLVAGLLKRLALPVSRETVRGHYECPNTTHADCGLGTDNGGIWPWSEYMEMIQDATKELP